ncbi:hypothetical protein [Verminephrobacter aporrectodeae]|uniref:hypothetical protein n=1 Tax=Verminephrobacter aporrectodeae TaxID=1110389 RepID=UPI002243173F|nr:hypothetical protein [Verminephrobacter aporrectodeae]
MAEDLSTENAPIQNPDVTNIGLEEQKHKLNTEQCVFKWTLRCASILFVVAISIAVIILFMLNANPQIHWHASLLVTAFVIPPTVIVIGLLRSVSKMKGNDKDDHGTGLVSLDIILDMLKLAVGKT